jgi:hypothetical protein
LSLSEKAEYGTPSITLYIDLIGTQSPFHFLTRTARLNGV